MLKLGLISLICKNTFWKRFEAFAALSQKSIFKQWEIYYVNFWINIWSEFNWIRPAIIFELSKYSYWRKNVLVIPITSEKKWKKYNKFDIKISPNKLNNLKSNSIIKLFHIRDVSKARVKTKIWKISTEKLNEIIEIFEKIYNKKPKPK